MTSARIVPVLAAVLMMLACGNDAAPAPFPDKAAPCQGLKSAAPGTTDNLSRLTAVYETCDGTSALHYVKGKVSVVSYAGNGRELIVGTDYASSQVVNGWIQP